MLHIPGTFIFVKLCTYLCSNMTKVWLVFSENHHLGFSCSPMLTRVSSFYGLITIFNMEESLEFESMPTLCRTALLRAEITLFKERSRQLQHCRQRHQLFTEKQIVFGGLRTRTTSWPSSNSRENASQIPQSHPLPIITSRKRFQWHK